SLEEVVHLEVGVAVVRVLDLGALTEERVRLVEEQDGAAPLRLVERGREVLLRLADVLGDHGCEVDAVEILAELARERLGGGGLPRTGRPGEERSDALAARQPAPEAPVVEHDM